MAMMMTGRVLLVCALCVLWCGAAVEAEGDDVTELQGEPSRVSQSPSKGGHEEEPDVRKPVGGVLNTSEEPSDARDLTKVSPQKTSVKQTPRDNGGAAEKEGKVEAKKAGDEETRSDGEEQPKDHSDETQESDGPKENERSPSPTPTDKMLTSEDPAAKHAGQAGQAIRPPPSPESDGTRPSGSSRGDSSVSPLSTAGISSSSALDAPLVQSTQPSEKGLQSETMSLGTALPNEQPKERSESKAKQGFSTSEEAAKSPDDSGDAVEKKKEKGDVGPKATTSLSSTTSNPPVTQTTPRPPSAEPSPTETELQAGEETSTENVTITKRNETTTPADTDGSTAASHTTSPPLLLLVFACAAAAAVVAA
ncbi:Mucin-associated surface protein (MASP) [Trypanosoma cruzi]|uniref:Mucin-associated surface protein (MASP), putative n=2 Tax=Trypanosoma cruzi TaxID=5693 RepID=Q4DVT5_TRYCC|nr:mucin-associated surface protein (MASP), putative [Trypanosoma cruzi]EAN96628.1 mucin-associated surface protein (MASP), putative [Trypanosoma cruzi]PWV21204.1 Mucin-associated surface protein (MASP) [Trypanosoma cruzi]|eukprot:XP_818479.1 mucin-associated surface protein (MASP) [Trypanosoma cruzi strain CL Brener]